MSRVSLACAEKQSGYYWQVTVENAVFRYKTMLGDKLHARNLSAQKTEDALGCEALKQMLEWGRPKSIAIARQIRQQEGT